MGEGGGAVVLCSVLHANCPSHGSWPRVVLDFGWTCSNVVLALTV